MARSDPVYDAWRMAARRYLSDGVGPEAVSWTSPREAQMTLFGTLAPPAVTGQSGGEERAVASDVSLPREVVQAMPWVAAHTDPSRWDTMYRIMWRLTHGERHLLRIAVDPDVVHFTKMLQAVRRDVHKMHAFVRFREATGKARFVAWYRPDHAIFRLATPHFVRRYPNMAWSIYSRHESAHWDTRKLTFAPGCERHEVAEKDTMEDLWGVYYGAIFNPARLKLRAMRAEMPVRYWSVMPETQLISKLIRESAGRVDAFYKAQPKSARDWLPAATGDWEALRGAALACAACDFCKQATQTVFGSGNLQARMFVVGEQPGDEEDTQGRPFVGPAGRLLDRALEDAHIPRSSLYLTNAVKHFKWTPRGKIRLHQRPLARDIAACKPWLAHELSVVQPEVVICLGATAAQAVFGRVTPVRDARGQWWRTFASKQTLVTTHPAHVLRLQDPGEREAAYEQLVTDLRMAEAALHAADETVT